MCLSKNKNISHLQQFLISKEQHFTKWFACEHLYLEQYVVFREKPEKLNQYLPVICLVTYQYTHVKLLISRKF